MLSKGHTAGALYATLAAAGFFAESELETFVGPLSPLNWHPNRLRHSAATSLRKAFGLEVARVILGHSSPAVTEVYAERDREQAASVMRQVG